MAAKEPLLPVTSSTNGSSSSRPLLKSSYHDAVQSNKKSQRILSGKSFKYRITIEQTENDPDVLPHRRDVLRIEKEAVIQTTKPALIQGMCLNFSPENAENFKILAHRVDSTIRAWYKKTFDELLHLYRIFEPLHGNDLIKQYNLTAEQLDVMENRFLHLLLHVMTKSNYKMITDKEYDVALDGSYKLSLPVQVDSDKLDKSLLSKYFQKVDVPHRPIFSDRYLMFRRGVGIDLTTDRFIMQKVDMVLGSIFHFLLVLLCLRKPKSWEPVIHDTRAEEECESMDANQVLSVERIHLDQMRISPKFLASYNTIQEPTFERVILLYRPSTPPDFPYPLGERTINLKHFRHIPMADMEIVLPEKKTPGLTNIDIIKFGLTIVLGLVAILKARSSPKVLVTILVACASYFLKIYLAWKGAMKNYSILLQQATYDKQLDSGHGTLLHLCDDVMEQEFKETMVSYFMLLTTSSATKEELDKRAESFMGTKFEENVQFDVEDAVNKLLRLGIAKAGSNGKLIGLPIKEAISAIGETTDEVYGTKSLVDDGLDSASVLSDSSGLFAF